MFGDQHGGLTAALKQAGIPADAAANIAGIFANCQQPLTHRGPITLNAPNEDATTEGHALTVLHGKIYVHGIANFVVYDTATGTEYTFQSISNPTFDTETCEMTTNDNQLVLRAS